MNLTPTEVAGLLIATAERHERYAQRCRATAADMARPATRTTPKHRARSGDSAGNLSARLVSILREHGAMKPAAIVKAAKAPDWQVRLALKELAADGVLITSGATISKTYALARKGGGR